MFSITKGIKNEENIKSIQIERVQLLKLNDPYIKMYTCKNLLQKVSPLGSSQLLSMSKIIKLIERPIIVSIKKMKKADISFITSTNNLIKDLVNQNILK